jgi:DNA-binding LacI/PurR family transcriptional regulator
MSNGRLTPKSLEELASHLGLSVGTVSRALNNRPEVREETRLRVAEAARKLGYVPNHAGRSLRQGTTNAIGFIVNSEAVTSSNAAMFYFELVNGIKEELAGHKLDLVMFTGSPGEDMAQYAHRLATRRIVDGVILAETQSYDERIAAVCSTGMPLVAFGQSDTPGDYPWLDVDFPGMASECVRRLYAQGHRKIAVSAGNVNLYYVDSFLKAYEDELRSLGVPKRENFIFTTSGALQEGVDIVNKIFAMAERPTAILNLYDSTSIGIYRGLEAIGKQAGADLAVIGHVNRSITGLLNPPLTGYELDVIAIGRELARLLISIIPGYAPTRAKLANGKVWRMNFVSGGSDLAPADA